MFEQAKTLVRKATARYVAPVVCSSLDAVDALRGRRRELVPPRRLSLAVGGGDFRAIGAEVVRILEQVGGVQPGDRVLDVGCGVGRMAVPLTSYLGEAGSYEGFDVYRAGIEWCAENITPRFPNFRFQAVDVRNATYNPRGATSAEEFTFPYGDGEFDFAFLSSVFTHMLPGSVQRYVSELARVVKVDGRCALSFFLLNDESRRRLAAGSSAVRFRYELDGCMTTSLRRPENAVAHDERSVRSLLEAHGFRVLEPIAYGRWCGREEAAGYQDFVVACRDAVAAAATAR